MKKELMGIYERSLSRERLSPEEGLRLLREAPLPEIGIVAQKARYFFHPEEEVTYIVDRNINYTNVCGTKCNFCAFYRNENDADSYTLAKEEVLAKIGETVELGGTGILLQGGHNPKIQFEYYTGLLETIRDEYPGIHIHAFSPPEIDFFSKTFGMDVGTVLRKLMDAGLMSVPGGGAEILSPATRKRIAPGKATGEEWLGVMETAHSLGMRTTATMMFGAGEEDEEIVDHLDSIRQLQDRTGGLTAFIPWTYQKGGKAKLDVEKASYTRYLKVLALSRIYLDNVRNVQASWLTQGLDIGQVALRFGANDLGSVMIEENVVREAGCLNRTNEEELRRTIIEAGFVPRKRRTLYEPAE